jgi:peroxiredoxin Q/BCP
VKAYRDQYAKVTEKGAQVVGISTDDVATLKRFRDENQLPYPLLSDEGGKVAKQFGGTIAVVGLASRATYVLEKDGTVKDVFTGSDAIDPGGAITSCPLHRKGGTP